MTVVVRDIHYHTINIDQLQVLLGYVESDLHDHSRQATAFSLLRAILQRRLTVNDMHDVMERIEKLSVSSEAQNVRMQCRQVSARHVAQSIGSNHFFEHATYD